MRQLTAFFVMLAALASQAQSSKLEQYQKHYKKKLSQIEASYKAAAAGIARPYRSAILAGTKAGKVNQAEAQAADLLLKQVASVQKGESPVAALFSKPLAIRESTVRLAKRTAWHKWRKAKDATQSAIYTLDKAYLKRLDALLKKSPDDADVKAERTKIKTAVASRKMLLRASTFKGSGRKLEIKELKLTMVPVKPGSFTMGFDTKKLKEPDGWYPEKPTTKDRKAIRAGIRPLPQESPAHDVKLTDPFWIGKTEVTQRQYQTLMGSSPSFHKQSGLDAPVERVSWQMAQDFCKKLTLHEIKAGRMPFGYVYRLPTEAEWEYCARGGGKGKKEFLFAGSDHPDDVSWHEWNCKKVKGHSRAMFLTHPVAKKKANALGLYDMSGNVSEWCYDRFDKNDKYYSVSPKINPTGGPGQYRVSRGGCVSDFFPAHSITRRCLGLDTQKSYRNGFRVVLAVPVEAF